MSKINWKRWWPYALLITLALGLYIRTLGADFLRWDDRQHILLNPWIEHSTLSLIWTRSYYNMYIPLTYTFWTVLWHTANQPWIFHLANLVLHAANSVLVYKLACRIFKNNNWAALVAALVFCTHPLQVETVAWISSGRDLLSAFLALLAANIILASETAGMIVLSTLLFGLALLSKPSVAVMPPALILISYSLGTLSRTRLKTLLFWFIPALAASYTTKRIQQLDADLRLPPMDIWHRLMVAADSFGFYVQKIFVPYPLAADYGRTREIALADNIWMMTFAALAVVAVILFIFRKRLNLQALSFAALFVLLFSPVLGLIPFQAQFQSTVSDRYAYLPLIAVGLLAGFLFSRQKLWPIVAALIVAWGTMTALRAEVWRTNEDFFTDMLAKNNNSHVALSSLGVEYILTGRLQQAEGVLNRATQLKPMDVIPRTNLAQLYLLFNRPDRVVTEIVPLLDDKEFLRINQTETRALASAYRLAGRAHWMLGLWTRGNEFFCRWFRLDYENEEGRREIGSFLEDARRHQVSLPNCEAVTAR